MAEMNRGSAGTMTINQARRVRSTSRKGKTSVKKSKSTKSKRSSK